MNKRMRTTVLLVGLMLISMVAAVNASPSKALGLPSEIKIGGVFPIVKRPDAGRDRRDAFQIAVDEINAQKGDDRILPAGVTLVPNVQDDDNSAAGGTAAAQALIAWGADIICGSSGSSVSAAMATELTPHKIVQISYASSSPALSDRELYPYFMRVVASDADQGRAIADLVQSFGWTRGATVHTSDSYGTGLIVVFTEIYEARGGTVITDQIFDPGATEVSAQVQAIKDATPQFVLGNFIDVDAATIMKKARDLGFIDVPWITTDGWSTTATFMGDPSVKEAMQLSIGTTPAPVTAPGYKAFNVTWFDPAWAKYEGPKLSQDTNIMFNAYAPMAYDSVYVAAKGLAAADSVDGDALLAALYDIEHDGASGMLRFNELGEVVGRYDYVQLVGGSYTSFGEWGLPPGATMGAPTYVDSSLLLADDTGWTVADNVFTQVKGPPVTTLTTQIVTTVVPEFGNEILVVLFSMGLIGIITMIIRRKRRK
ncbi:MAG: ABC transporter substrate-binding protein [Candidatus Heimdallarchaeota archaeon]